MKVILSVLCLVLLGLSSVRCESTEFVVDITDEDSFSTFLAENKKATLIEFYAPWCGHCKKLLPEFEKAAEELSEDGIKLGKVDCTGDDTKAVCDKFKVRGYPTIKFFKDEEPQEYQGGRVSAEIVNYLQSRTGPAVADADTADKITAAAAKKVTVVIFQKDKTGDFEAFTKVADGMRDDARFFISTDEAMAKTLEAEFPSVTLFRSFDEKVVKFDGKIADELEQFIMDESFPLCGAIGPDNYMKYMQRGEPPLPLAWLAVKFDGEDSTDPAIAVAREVAADFKGKISIVYIDGVKFKGHLENLGLSEDLPGLVITDSDNKKYLYEQDAMTAANLRTYFTKFVDGKLESHMKSEPIPETNDKEVKVVVGHTFDELVISNEKDVLVEFYAPWCGHCKALESDYTLLGERFAENENIVITKVDATKNDAPVEVQGFPTLMLFRSGHKEEAPLEYSGERTADALETWLQKECTHGDKTAIKDEDEEEDDSKSEL